MSHASLIAALSPEQIEEHGGVNEAVAWNMEPFDENGEWFGDGSRWDWYQIGGRCTSKFDPGYNPERDPANIETCDLCGGTGKRADMVVLHGCNGCQGAGERVKWPTQWVNHGDIAIRKDIEHLAGKLKSCAFLRDRKWHEQRRMGWFGGSTATECERKAEEQGDEHSGRCLHTCERTGARIVSWDSEDSQWDQLYWVRFIRSLPPDTLLVCVDYHV